MSGQTSTNANEGGVHSLLGRLAIASQIVAAKSKGTPQLWHATATASTHKPVEDVWSLDNIDATFIVDGKHVYVMQETHWSKFETPIEKGEFTGNFLGAGLIQLPLPIGAAEAEHSMRNLVKTKEQIKSVELAWRVTRFTAHEPFYFFTMADGTRHAVGAESGKMATED